MDSGWFRHNINRVVGNVPCTLFWWIPWLGGVPFEW